MDKMIWGNKSYDLAKNTLSIARMIEAAEKSETMVDAYNNELALVIAALGEEVAESILETTDIEEVDLGTLVMVYNSVIDGYEKRITDMRIAKEQKLINSPTVKGVSKLAEDVRVIKSVEGSKA